MKQVAACRAAEKRFQAVIVSEDPIILRLTTLYENARSALECGPPSRARLEFQTLTRISHHELGTAALYRLRKNPSGPSFRGVPI
jgi:hypothetical protein